MAPTVEIADFLHFQQENPNGKIGVPKQIPDGIELIEDISRPLFLRGPVPRGGLPSLRVHPAKALLGSHWIHHRHRTQGKKRLQLGLEAAKLPGLNLGDAPAVLDVRHPPPHFDLVECRVRLEVVFQRGVERPLPQGANASGGLFLGQFQRFLQCHRHSPFPLKKSPWFRGFLQ